MSCDNHMKVIHERRYRKRLLLTCKHCQIPRDGIELMERSGDVKDKLIQCNEEVPGE